MVFRRHRRLRWILRQKPGRDENEEDEKVNRSQSPGTPHHDSGEQRGKLEAFMSVVPAASRLPRMSPARDAHRRRRLSWAVGAWLLFQIANVAAAPVAFCCQNVAIAGDDEKCCPGLLPGQVCPMHHTKEGVATCRMRSMCAGTDASLVALAGGLGAMPVVTAVVRPFALGDPLPVASRPSILRTDRPESPPPRA
jgi:hypothetical protein